MCYELFHQPTELHRKFSRQSWAKALELAQYYGWKPMGTKPPSMYNFHILNAEWDGTYFTNDGQTVKAEDALSLAQALHKSLDDIPDEHIKMDWDPKFWREADFPEWLAPFEQAMIEDVLEGDLLDIMATHPINFFAGAEKHQLAEMIRFCQLGSFLIM